VTSKLWFDRLPKDLQDIVTNAAQQTSRDIYEFSVQKMESALDTWRQNNGEVVTLSEDEQKQLFEMLRPLGASIMAKKPEEKVIFDLLTKTVDKLK
jgi:TRAP-type C4-dicarboxylate transport system substrate-binding protein